MLFRSSEKTQQNSAYVLADKICQALGMESNQIGIDVAADAEYSAVTDDTANMSDYFSEWDKSYHITTVTGGEYHHSVQALVSGIDLKQNGKYRLSFQIDTSEDMEIPFYIKNKLTGEVIFKDVFNGTGTKLAYEIEFDNSTITSDVQIVFEMGGTDNSRVSIHELKLVRIA